MVYVLNQHFFHFTPRCSFRNTYNSKNFHWCLNNFTNARYSRDTTYKNNFNHIAIQRTVDLYSNNVCDFNKMDIQLAKTSEKEEIKSTTVQSFVCYKSQKAKISAENTRNFRKHKILVLADSQGQMST